MRKLVGTFAVLALAVVVGCAPPTANFTADTTSGDAPLEVQFTDTSVVVGPLGLVDFKDYSPITSWAWTFGDGGGSTEQSPSHSYNDGGTYSVSLTVTNEEGTDTHTEVSLITVTEVGPTADFEYSNVTGNTPLTVHFTNTSLLGSNPENAAYLWDFQVGTSVAKDASFTFNTPGVYTVSLTVTTPLGSDTFEVVGLANVS